MSQTQMLKDMEKKHEQNPLSEIRDQLVADSVSYDQGSDIAQELYRTISENKYRSYFTTETIDYRNELTPIDLINRWNALATYISNAIFGYRAWTKKKPRFPKVFVALGTQENGNLHIHTLWIEEERWRESKIDFPSLYREAINKAGIGEHSIKEVYSSAVIDYMIGQTKSREVLGDLVIPKPDSISPEDKKSKLISALHLSSINTGNLYPPINWHNYTKRSRVSTPKSATPSNSKDTHRKSMEIRNLIEIVRAS